MLAKKIVLNCMRDSFLEELHAGTTPSSKSGDYSDVKVMTPFGEIPWSRLSRISDEEMKHLMKDVTNKVYTLLTHIENEEFLSRLSYPNKWDAPELDPEIDFLAKKA
ncbi:MAG: hypothetical protein HYZ71_17430 [Deltaproteobacteria bacterium]|nr:hypothetical protein [Deltaproteobacteria bacterium]